MAMPKNPALFIMSLLAALLLTGCGGQPLSKREIVRAVFFERQGSGYSVCLLLANQNAPEGEPAFKTASAAASTPAQALENAAAALPGTVYYGLLDAAALPVDTDWAKAQEIGLLLYDRAQPAPELSVFLLDGAPHDWQKDAQSLYEHMQAIEERYKVHCGLQQLFTRRTDCAVPGLPQGTGYDFTLLASDSAPRRCKGLTAQLAALLAGQTTRLEATFAADTAACTARAEVTSTGDTIQLHLHGADLRSLAAPAEETSLCQALEADLQTSFRTLARTAAANDLLHFTFWQQTLYGSNAAPQTPALQILWE